MYITINAYYKNAHYKKCILQLIMSPQHSGDCSHVSLGHGMAYISVFLPMENGDGGQVGGTGGEGFGESSSWRHLDDCDNCENVGGEDNQEATHTSLSVEMKHISWLKWVSEQEAEVMAEYSQPKWCMT